MRRARRCGSSLTPTMSSTRHRHPRIDETGGPGPHRIQRWIGAVRTPSPPDDGFDLTEVERAVDEVAKHLHPSTVIARKSTVPPGTCDRLQRRWFDLELASLNSSSERVRARPSRVPTASSSARRQTARRAFSGTSWSAWRSARPRSCLLHTSPSSPSSFEHHVRGEGRHGQ